MPKRPAGRKKKLPKKLKLKKNQKLVYVVRLLQMLEESIKVSRFARKA